MISVSGYISKFLGEQGIIKQEDIEICKYGIDFFIISVLEILSVIIVSAFVGNFVLTLLYFAAFIPLRIYAGGYHADTKLGCYAILIAVYAIFTALVKYLPASYFFPTEMFSQVITAVMVFLYAPIVNDSKTVNGTEMKNYRRFSIVIMLAEVLAVLTSMLIFGDSKYVLAFSLGQAAVALSMVAALVKAKLKGGEKNE